MWAGADLDATVLGHHVNVDGLRKGAPGPYSFQHQLHVVVGESCAVIQPPWVTLHSWHLVENALGKIGAKAVDDALTVFRDEMLDHRPSIDLTGSTLRIEVSCLIARSEK